MLQQLQEKGYSMFGTVWDTIKNNREVQMAAVPSQAMNHASLQHSRQDTRVAKH